MIDHIVLAVKDYEKSKAFYVKALAPLGYGIVMEPMPKMGGFGKNGKPDLWLGEMRPTYWSAEHAHSVSPIHVAITAPNRAAVNAFYAAAIAAGGRDFGPPGPRPIYHPNYYGAFVLDLDGNNLEAVVHAGE